MCGCSLPEPVSHPPCLTSASCTVGCCWDGRMLLRYQQKTQEKKNDMKAALLDSLLRLQNFLWECFCSTQPACTLS